MNFLILIEGSVQASNALHKNVELLLPDLKNKTTSDVKKFYDLLKEAVNKLSAKHPRCKPLKIDNNFNHLRNFDDKGMIYIRSGNYYTHLSLNPILGEVNSIKLPGNT